MNEKRAQRARLVDTRLHTPTESHTSVDNVTRLQHVSLHPPRPLVGGVDAELRGVSFKTYILYTKQTKPYKP